MLCYHRVRQDDGRVPNLYTVRYELTYKSQKKIISIAIAIAIYCTEDDRRWKWVDHHSYRIKYHIMTDHWIKLLSFACLRCIVFVVSLSFSHYYSFSLYIPHVSLSKTKQIPRFYSRQNQLHY